MGYDEADLYLVHGDEERQFGLVEDAAGVQHVGHEGHRVDAARCVHDVHHHCGKGRGLKHRDAANTGFLGTHS